MRVFCGLFVALALLVACTGWKAQPRQNENWPLPVWLDTDISMGIPERDVDDGMALVQAFRSSELSIKGFSTVFGNAPLEKVHPIAQKLISLQIKDAQVFRGAARPGDNNTEAAAQIAQAIDEGPIHLVALGPVTNIAAAVKRRPKHPENLKLVVAVAGRRPGQRFTTGSKNKKAHRDFNFESDPEAFRFLIENKVPLVLVPFELSSQVWINEPDLNRMEQIGETGRLLSSASRSWLKLWKDVFDVDGFNPFDSMAIVYLTHPTLLECEKLPVNIEEHPDDGTERRMQGTKPKTKPYLLLAKNLHSNAEATYCFRAKPGVKEAVLTRLADSRYFESPK